MNKLLLLLTVLFISCSVFASVDDPYFAKLTNIAGASGFEKPVRDSVKQQWQPFMASLDVDGIGNLIGESLSTQAGPRVLLMAHMDEIGYIVESVTPDGFIKVVPLGGIYNGVIYAQRWYIATPKGPVLAYSGMDSPHLLDDVKKTQYPLASDMFLDIGATSQAQAMNQFGVRMGLQVTPVTEFAKLGNTRYLAKALDDRLGLALISDVLANLKSKSHPNQLYAAATVQEEVGVRGASTVFDKTHAEVVINIEAGIADDYPHLLADRKGRIALGKGPTLFVYDKYMIPHQGLLNWVIALAEKNHIPVQLEVEPGYGEDGAKLQTSGPGMPAINIGIPIRYAHQQAGVFDKNDYDQAVKLVTLVVENLNQQAMNQIKVG